MNDGRTAAPVQLHEGKWSLVIASADRRLARLKVYRSDSRPLVKLQSLLAAVAIVTVVLLFLLGAVTEWQNGAGRGSVGVDILWRVVWVLYTLAKLILIAVLIATIRQWVVSRRRSSLRAMPPRQSFNSGVFEWRRIPWPLWLYSGVVLMSTALVEAKASGPIAAKLLFPAVMLVWLYFLLRGVRWVWVVTIAVDVLGLVSYVTSGSLDWKAVILGLFGITLLVLPVTWRYFLGHTATVSG